MSELERARKHLRHCQDLLSEQRGQIRHAVAPSWMDKADAKRAVADFIKGVRIDVRAAEEIVIAALSWVWDAQERAGKNVMIEPGMVITFASGEQMRVVAQARGAS